MKQKLMLSFIFSAWLFAVVSVLMPIVGCNVNKHITKTSTDSTTVKKVDSTSSQLLDLSKSEGSSSIDSNSIQVDFYNIIGEDSITWTPRWIKKNGTDTIHPSVIINPTKDGGFTIQNNTANKIKSIKIKDAKILETHKSTDSATAKTSAFAKVDSSSKKIVTEDESKIRKSGWSILDWIGLIVVGIAIIWIAGAIYLKANPLAWLLGFIRRKREDA